MLSRAELITYVDEAPLKDVRTFNLILVDMLNEQQLKKIEAYFEKKIMFKPKGVKKKKEPQKAEKEPSEVKKTSPAEKGKAEVEFPDIDDVQDDEGVDDDDTDDNEVEGQAEIPEQKRPMTQEEINAIIEGNIPDNI